MIKTASQSELNDPNAAALATVRKDGQPSVRMILFRNVDKKSFYFRANMKSRKRRELTDSFSHENRVKFSVPVFFQYNAEDSKKEDEDRKRTDMKMPEGRMSL